MSQLDKYPLGQKGAIWVWIRVEMAKADVRHIGFNPCDHNDILKNQIGHFLRGMNNESIILKPQ